MRCYICDYHAEHEKQHARFDFTIDEKGREICSYCVQQSRRYWKHQGAEGASDLTTNLDKVVDELLLRIPALFNSALPVCPGSCRCNCTYKSGCKLMLDKGSK